MHKLSRTHSLAHALTSTLFIILGLVGALLAHPFMQTQQAYAETLNLQGVPELKDVVAYEEVQAAGNVYVSGWATPDCEVHVGVGNREQVVRAAADGSFSCEISGSTSNTCYIAAQNDTGNASTAVSIYKEGEVPESAKEDANKAVKRQRKKAAEHLEVDKNNAREQEQEQSSSAQRPNILLIFFIVITAIFLLALGLVFNLKSRS